MAGAEGCCFDSVRDDTAVRPLRDRALLRVLVTGTAYALIHQQTVTILPLALPRQGLPPADAGLVFTATAATTVLAQPLIRLPWTARLTTPAALALAHVLLAAGLTGYALAHTLPPLLVAAAAGSLGDLLIMGRVYALVTDGSRAWSQRATPTGTFASRSPCTIVVGAVIVPSGSGSARW